MSAGTFNQPTAGYQQQPAYGHQAAAGRSGMAVTGLVFGILAMLTFWIWGAVLFAPPAIVLGVMGRNEARKTGRDGEGLGTAALILGIVAIVLTVPWALFVAMS